MDLSPPRKKLKNPLGDIARAINDVNPLGIIPIRNSTNRTNAVHQIDIRDSDLTWKNYIESQEKYNMKSPLRYASNLKQILIAKSYKFERNVGDLQIRESFESLLEVLHGPYNGLQDTMNSLPAQQGRQLQISNEKLAVFTDSWSFHSDLELHTIQKKQSTQDIVRKVNIYIVELAIEK